MEKMAEYTGWAIDSQSAEGHGLIGRYWWFTGKPVGIPNHMEGHLNAVFPTRREARAALPSTKRAFPKAKVVKVKVTIEIL